MPADPRPPTTPLNERGLRARFIPWSEPASPAQQDRLRKCRLTSLQPASNDTEHAIRTTEHAPPAAARKPRAKASLALLDGGVSYGDVRPHRAQQQDSGGNYFHLIPSYPFVCLGRGDLIRDIKNATSPHIAPFFNPNSKAKLKSYFNCKMIEHKKPNTTTNINPSANITQPTRNAL